MLSNQDILQGLLQHNFFPSQKDEKEELPPILNSKGLTSEIVDEISKLSLRRGGYDQVEYRSTRYNNVSRNLAIPHPLAYIKLAVCLSENWKKLDYISKNKNSLIKPELHDDGRIIIMDYESSREKLQRHITKSFNKKFFVKTDISNCFPSIYSHAIPWALVGLKKSKNNREPSEWFNKIDTYQRLMKRNETNGVPIGPATSNIISESILARVDEKISRNFDYVRFIDDYTAYCETYEKAECFIRRLSEELSTYKLLLNIKKTSIEKLPLPSSADWIVDLNTRMPDKNDTNTTSIIRFMDYAVKKQEVTPDGSVLKYAAKSIISDINNDDEKSKIEHLDKDTLDLLIQYLLGLCVKYPILLPLLDIMFDSFNSDSNFVYSVQFFALLKEHVTHKRSDAIAWSLYYLNKFSQDIPSDIANKIIETGDCISILALFMSRNFDNEIKDFIDKLGFNDLFLLDQYWILLYQLFFVDIIENPYGKDESAYTHFCSNKEKPKNTMDREIQVFRKLKENNVSFLNNTDD